MSGPCPSARAIGAAQVFCDESGGSDAANAVFLTAAVAISAAHATRLLKSFRKATGLDGEVKGHRIALGQRAIFVDLLAKQPDVVSAVVACSRLDAVGGWAMGALPEVELYRHLLAEACVALPGLDTARHLTVTPDRPRYKKSQVEPVRAGLTRAVAARHPAARVAVGFGDSAELPGLQVADVVANSVFQSLVPSAATEAVARLLAPLVARGVLHIRRVQLEGTCPEWLVSA